MLFDELKERCRNRNFDRIVVVVRDIFQDMADMQRIKNVVPGDIRICTSENSPGLNNADGEIVYCQREASYFYENTEICVIQPMEGETLYKKYLDRFGECICSVRERVAADEFDAMVGKFREKNLKIAQWMESDSCRAVWLDLSDELGILFEMITDDSKKIVPSYVIPERIAQINITSPNVRKTIEKITDYLEIGPWEVGRQCNATVHDSGFLVNGKLEDAEFDFLLAILPCGNIEWEVIEPVKGPLVYYDFLNRRGIGYHHVLQEIPQARWDQIQEQYEKNGAGLACKGSLGPVNWCYMNTEDTLHFYTEMRNDAVMTKLPDAVKTMLDQIEADLGSVDVVHNNAGVGGALAPDIEEWDPEHHMSHLEHWKQVLDINLVSQYIVATTAARVMIREGHGGSIINTASMAGHVVNQAPMYQTLDDSSYGVSKAGVLYFTRHFASQVIKYGIRVNSISPGYCYSPGLHDGLSSEIMDCYVKTQPIMRMAEVEELQGAVLYLASDASTYTVGHDIMLDGGHTIW